MVDVHGVSYFFWAAGRDSPDLGASEAVALSPETLRVMFALNL